MMCEPKQTATITDMRPCAQASYGLPQSDWNFEEDTEYGPFFRVDNVEGKVRWKPEEWYWVGFAEPRTKEEAIEWYALKEHENPMTHVHKIFLEIPKGVTNAWGIVGKVKDGTGFQVNLNAISSEYVKKIGKPKPLE